MAMTAAPRHHESLPPTGRPYFTIETIALVIALTIGSVGLGGLFVVSSVCAFSTVAPEETGVTSGALSTFHELGAAIGVSAASSIAAASLTGSGTEGITTTFGIAAMVALAAALISTAALPGRTPRAEPRDAVNDRHTRLSNADR